jgi:4'-phosphopantetheinyl transferase EntD
MSTEAFEVAFAEAHPFGFLVGVALPPGKDSVADAALGRLDRREAAFAATLTGFRRIRWVGGRLAAQAAGRHLGARSWSLLVGPDGAPMAPEGYSLSIAHKQDLAIALVSDVAGEHLGVDLEDDVHAAREIEAVFLSIGERKTLDSLPASERDRALLLAFALKEATYKAFASHVGRSLGYHEAGISLDAAGEVSLAARFTEVSPQPALEIAQRWRGERVIAAVRERKPQREDS